MSEASKETANETFRKAPPEPLAAIAFNLPKPEEREMANGMKLVFLEDKRHPILNIRIAFRSGDINDPGGGVGVNSATAAMLNEGTKSFKSRELAEEIERLGATLSARAGFDNTVVRASTLSKYRRDILKLTAEMVLKPTFPDDELKLYKQNTIEGLKFQRSQPDFLADEQVARIVYGKHPYGINSATAEEVDKITRDQLVSYHKSHYIPNNATMFIVGDFDSAESLEEIEELFGDWKAGEIDDGDFPEFPERTQRTLTIVDRPGSSQANIVLANLAINRSSPDYFPVLVMNQVLGAGASSRLFMNLREEKGYTYGAYSRFYARRHGGAFEATSEVRTVVTGDSLKEFFLELDKIRDEEVPKEELNDAKNYLTGVFPIRAETQQGLTGLIVSQKMFDLPDDYLDTYRDRVNAVTAEDIKRVANEYITPATLALIIVGDAEDVIPQARIYSDNIEVFDTEGKPKDLSDYREDSFAETAQVGGIWELSIDAQGQELTVTLNLEQEGGEVTGTLESMLGSGEIGDGKVTGRRMSATAVSEFQGQEVELAIKCTVDGESIEGTISVPMIPVPLEFKGNRKA